jgi:hypothetical protein
MTSFKRNNNQEFDLVGLQSLNGVRSNSGLEKF